MNTNTLKRSIMRRVYAVYLFKRVFSPTAIKLFFIAALLVRVHEVVAFRSVLANALAFDLSRIPSFWAAAFANTELGVKLFTLAILALSLWVVRDIFRAAPDRSLSLQY